MVDFDPIEKKNRVVNKGIDSKMLPVLWMRHYDNQLHHFGGWGYSRLVYGNPWLG